MKILFIITQSELGGAQRWVFDTATSLRVPRETGGEAISVTVAAGGNGPLISYLDGRQDKILKLTHLVREINPIKDFLGLIEIYRLIKKEKPDVLQLCSTKAGLLGSLATLLYKISSFKFQVSSFKIIYRIGGWSFNDPRPRWQKKLFLLIEKWTAPLKDKIIVNSQHDYDQALRLKIADKNKLVLLYNGINIENPKLQITNYKLQILTIGVIANFYPTKGLLYLIRAIALLNSKFEIRNSKFIIVGDGPQRPLLEKLIKENKLENTIKLVGQKKDPWGYFKEQGGIDIFVIPSVKEGMPYVLLEAMSRGLPIIATKVGGIPEIIEDEKSGLLVPPANPEALAKEIVLLINDRKLIRQIGKNSYQRVQDFSLEKMIKEYEQIITE